MLSLLNSRSSLGEWVGGEGTGQVTARLGQKNFLPSMAKTYRYVITPQHIIRGKFPGKNISIFHSTLYKYVCMQ